MLTKLFTKVRANAKKNANGKKQLGVTAIEYAIIGVAISGIVLAVMQGTDGNGGLKGALDGAMNKITSNVSTAGTVADTSSDSDQDSD